MADISITQAHVLSHNEARDAAQAQQIAQEFDMAIAWQGDVLSFTRTGTTGHHCRFYIQRICVHDRGKSRA